MTADVDIYSVSTYLNAKHLGTSCQALIGGRCFLIVEIPAVLHKH